MKTLLFCINCQFRPTSPLLWTLFGLLFSAGRASAALPTAHDLVVVHSELNEEGDPHDALLWQGTAKFFSIYQFIDNQPGVELATIPGKTGTFQVNEFAARPIAPTRSVVLYEVLGYNSLNESQHALTNWVSTQELLEDPGFNDPSEATWTQLTTSDADNIPQLASFIGRAGFPSAQMGGGTSRTDVIFTSNPVNIPSGDRGSFVAKNGSLQLVGMCGVDTEESPDETIAYDNLDVEVREFSTGRLLSTHHISDNRNRGETDSVNFSISLDYNLLKGATVQLVFRARNDEILATTFLLENIELDENIAF